MNYLFYRFINTAFLVCKLLLVIHYFATTPRTVNDTELSSSGHTSLLLYCFLPSCVPTNKYIKNHSEASSATILSYIFFYSDSLRQGWADFWWEGRITGLWIIKEMQFLKSKEFSVDSSASVYFLLFRVTGGPHAAHSLPPPPALR